MPHNIDLEYIIDKLSNQLGEITKKMFGCIGYLFGGNMSFGIYKKYLILRTSPKKAWDMLKSEYVTQFDITGKPMKGWVMIFPDYVETDGQLTNMLKLGIEFASNLPAN